MITGHTGASREHSENNITKLGKLQLESELGYVQGNIAVITHRMNTIKSFGTAIEHRLIAEYLERHGDGR